MKLICQSGIKLYNIVLVLKIIFSYIDKCLAKANIQIKNAALFVVSVYGVVNLKSKVATKHLIIGINSFYQQLAQGLILIFALSAETVRYKGLV